jgi:predicted nucleic acid-binding protein
MIVVSNSSPLIGMAAIGQLDLLEKLYYRIHIPQAVFQEVVIIGARRAGSSEVQTSDWIVTHTVNPAHTSSLMTATGLDVGESEAIILAKTLPADYLVLDDIQGRKYAFAEGLQVVGAVGVLLLAKQHGYIKRVKPPLDDLLANGYFINPRLYQMVLFQAGEIS